ncbi:MAG: MFS transporter [Verrucomicrobiota bacterium]
MIKKVLGPGFGLLGQRDFGSLWGGNLFSNTGTFMMIIAAGWEMSSMTQNAALVAMVQTALSLPFFFFVIPGGIITDLVNHRRLLIIMQTSMLLAVAVIAWCSWTGRLTPWVLLGLLTFVGIGTAVHQPAWKTLLQDLVTREQSASAVALNSLNFNIGRAIGPFLGGMLAGIGGAASVFACKSLSYVSVIGALWPIPNERMPQPKTGVTASSVISSIGEGFSFLKTSPILRGILLRYGLFILPASGMMALLPLEARRELGSGVFGYGALMSFLGVGELLGALGVGAVIGSLFIPGLKQRFSIDSVVMVTLVCFSLCILGVSQGNSMLLDDLFLIVGGAAWSVMTVTHQVAVQFCSPDWVRGRTTSFYMLTLEGATAIGSLTFGWIAQLTTIRESIMLCAVVSMLGILLIRRFPLTDDSSEE